MAAELPTGLFRPVEHPPFERDAATREPLLFINGDINSVRTGGTLLDRDIVEQLSAVGINVQVTLPALVKRNARAWKPMMVGLLANLLEAFRRFDKGATVLVSHGSYRDIWLAKWIWLLRFRIRIVYLIYHFDFNLSRGLARTLRRLIESLSLRGSTLVFTISEASRQQVLEMGVPPAAVRLLPIMQTRAPLQELPPRSFVDRCTFLFVGTVEPRKGLHIALEALASLSSDLPCELLIAGVHAPDHAYTQSLMDKAANLNNFTVRFLGRVPDLELEALYLRADAFLFPTLWEGYGIAVEEALSYGLPVISTTAGAIPELVRDGLEGWLVPPENAAALEQALRECIQNPGERARRAQRALDRAKERFRYASPGATVREAVINLLYGLQ